MLQVSQEMRSGGEREQITWGLESLFIKFSCNLNISFSVCDFEL